MRIDRKGIEIDLTNKESLISYLKQNGLWAKKALGQNFLVDRKVLDRIVEAAELSPSDTVLEIGPGLGVLTEELVGKAGEVLAIEKDEKLAKILNNELGIMNKGNIKIINNDALEFEPSNYNLKPENPEGAPQSRGYKLVANIPYYITSKILQKFLSGENKPSLIVLLVQKEVAERICASRGGHSLLSISVQYYGKPEIIATVPRTSFFPAPEVNSAILRIKIQPDRIQNPASEKEFFKMVRAGFRARRKTLFNNLKAGTDLGGGQIEEILDKMGIASNARAQELNLRQWQELTDSISQKLKLKSQK